ncbi:hypothetical protein CBR65_10285 [Cellvibrio sp. PSBB006]|nr:hypothetical protein CBR65_10285 [Cellvibrio sp. PSBB006]
MPEPSSSSSGNSSAGSSSGGGSASSSGGGNSSSGNGGDDGGSGSSSPGNPVPADSTCPNKFQIGDQWYCQSNPMPSSEGQASSDGADAAAAGTCGAAPVCNGDPVGCAILLNAHYHRCNTDKQSTAAGSCGEEPSCTGDPVGCSVLKQTWLINCQDHQQNSDLVENNFGSGLDGFKTEDEGKFNEFITTLTEEGEETDENGVLTQLAPDRIDLSSQDFGLSDVYAIGNSPSSGSCPPPRTIQLSVGSYEVSYEPFCDLATQLSGFLVLIFSYLSSLLIYRSLQGV